VREVADTVGFNLVINRQFKDIPKGGLKGSDQQSLLVSLGWSKALTWEKLLESQRILIISEAGAGKTYKCQEMAKRLWADGEPAFFIELATLADDGSAGGGSWFRVLSI
jgi:hypothetical protein